MGATTNQNPAVMAPIRIRICAYIPCLCNVPDGEQYCGAACRDAAKEDAKTRVRAITWLALRRSGCLRLLALTCRAYNAGRKKAFNRSGNRA
jgi:hypothetical protein